MVFEESLAHLLLRNNSTTERLERRSPSTIDNCLVESKLFAVPIGSSEPFPEDIADFRPLRYRCSARMVMFVSKL